MLWLQLHFPSDAWDSLAIGGVSLTDQDAIRLSQTAEHAGLRVYFPK